MLKRGLEVSEVEDLPLKYRQGKTDAEFNV